MERALTQFIRALRAAGAAVSSAEAIDAARALAVVGYAERERMRDALGIVLAKSEEEKRLHDDLFDVYFSRAAAQAQREREQQAGRGRGDDEEGAGKASGKEPDGERDGRNDTGDRRDGDADGGDPSDGGAPTTGDAREGDGAQAGGQPGSGGGGGGGGRQPARDRADEFLSLAQSGDADRIAVAMEQAGVAAGVDEIRFASQTPYYVRRMLEHLGVDALERRLLQRLNAQGEAAQAEARTLIEARSTLQRHARHFVDQRFEVFGRAATDAFLDDVAVNRAIGELSLRDIERMKVLVARMARRLAVRHSRRRRVRNRGQLDMRRTMRANAGHDGVPVELVWRRKRRDRPKIVAICDVSGSVSQYVRFLLLFLHALKDEVADLEAFAFSAHLESVAHELQTLPFEKAMDRIIGRIGGGSTDYGVALADLKNHHWNVIDRRTTILVLGDGRSNHADPRLDIFQEAADRAKRLVWLCPEPRVRWGTGDSVIPKYQPFCTHLTHCATALDLERALDEVLTAYD
jgi:uncharacterized protein with von Willebrand factor type A (vWA) domain